MLILRQDRSNRHRGRGAADRYSAASQRAKASTPTEQPFAEQPKAKGQNNPGDSQDDERRTKSDQQIDARTFAPRKQEAT